MNARLIDLITQKPLDELPSAPAHCVQCGGRNLRLGNQSHTLLGGGDGTRDGDPNHWWSVYDCSDCGTSFVRETKSGNVWYTDAKSGRVYRGMSNCFETYIYTHAGCGGDLTRRYTTLDGVTPVQTLGMSNENGQWVRHYRVFWDCDKCGCVGETDASDD